MASWEEREHPRDEIGRFRDKWAGRAASRLGGLFGHYVRGRDRSAQVRDGRKFRRKLHAIARDSHPDDGDTALAEIMKLQGWGAPSRFGTDEELQTAIDHGGVELWRGYWGHVPELWGWGEQAGAKAPYNPDSSPMARQRQTVEGPLWVGSGIYANGWYTSVSREAGSRFSPKVLVDDPGDATVLEAQVSSYDPVTLEPAGYTWRIADPRGLQRMVLSPDARVVDFGAPELDEFVQQVGDDYYYVWNQQRGQHVRGVEPLQEYGAAAASLGYDAIRVPSGKSDGSGLDAEQYIILNRTAVLFAPPHDESNLPPGLVTEAQWRAAPTYDFDTGRMT